MQRVGILAQEEDWKFHAGSKGKTAAPVLSVPALPFWIHAAEYKRRREG